MAEEERDLYAELGVPPDADARAIKVAYFTLVRQFPPETHAERFQRIREAYEVLSEPARRAAYDEARRAPPAPADPEASALWDAARDAREARDLEAELRALRRLVEVRPALERPRELLAARLLDHGEAGEAEAVLRPLLEAQPAHPGYLLRWAQVQRELGRPDEALDALRRARACGPVEDPSFLVALADGHAALRLWGEARAAVLEAARLEASPRLHPALQRRLSAWLVEEGKAEEGVAALERSVDDWAGAPEGTERRDALAFLAGFAVYLSSRGRWALANRVLARVRAAAPDASPGPLPESVLLHERELPAEARDWLRSQQDQPTWLTRYYRDDRRRWLLKALPGLLATAGVAWMGFAVQDPFVPGGWLLMAALLTATLAWLLWALQNHAREGRNPFGRGLVLHALHLLEVDYDRVRVTPLPAIGEITITPGSGGAGVATVTFRRRGGGSARLLVATRAAADELVQAVMGQRQRALDLLAEGSLHHEDLWDLFPPEVLARGGLARRLGLLRPRALGLKLAALVAASVAISLVAARSASDAAERRAWAEAERVDTVKGYQAFLRTWPDGPNAERARGRPAALAAAAHAALVEAGASPLLLEVVDATLIAGQPVPLRVEGHFRGLADGPPGRLEAWPLLDQGLAQRGLQRVVKLVGASLATAARSASLQVEPVAAAEPRRPLLRIAVRYLASGDELSPAPRSSRWALALDAAWTVELLRPGEATPVRVADGQVEGPAEVKVGLLAWNGTPEEAAARVYEPVVEDLAAKVAAAALRALGVAPAGKP